MPCDTVRTVTLDLTVADNEVLLRGLKAAGFTVYEQRVGISARSKSGALITIANGKASVEEGDEAVVNEVKRAYSNEAVRTAAKRFGWTTKQDAKTGAVTLSRRAF